MHDYEINETLYYEKLDSISPVTVNLLGTFSLSSKGVALFYETQTLMISCSYEGILQRWSKVKNKFILEEEVSISSMDCNIVAFNLSPRGFNENDIKHEQKNNHCEYIKCMSYCSILQMFCICYSNGQAAIIKWNNTTTLMNSIKYMLPVNRATYIALNPVYHLIAVGMDTGEVLIFNESQDFQFERELSLKPWGSFFVETGSVSSIKWSPDYKVISVGYENRGFSVWTNYGCRLSYTLIKSKGSSSNSRLSGISDMAWGKGGYHLIVAKSQAKGKLEQYSFVKSCISVNINLNYCQRSLLQGEDFLLLLYSRSGENRELKWKKIQIPFTFIKENWPIRYVSLSKDGNNIAVSGRRGFCTYNVINSRWSIFNNRSEEQTIHCCGICWFKDSVVITNLLDSSTYEIIFFNKSRLSLAHVLCREVVPRSKRPLYVDCNNTSLILFTADSFFYQYLIACSTDNCSNICLSLAQQISVERELQNPLSILLLPDEAQISSSDEKVIGKDNAPKHPRMVLLDESGTLSIYNTENSSVIPLSNSVEQFWMANSELEDLGNSLWAYGKLGLEVWFPFFTQKKLQPLSFLSRDRSLEFDLEVYPVGFTPQKAVIVGISQSVKHICTDNPFFTLKTTTEPFLHSVLSRMISKGDIDDAIHIARKYSRLPHFLHSLELLLYETLEECYDYTTKGGSQSETDQKRKTFTQVFKFLKSFGFNVSVEITLFCARKTDPEKWGLLFDKEYGAGDPRDLFEFCIKTENLSIASSYLAVLQITESENVTRSAALKCLELSLKLNDQEIFEDLTRFLASRNIKTNL